MTTVLAYLDPGSGSMILQIIAGGLAAVAVTAKLYWNRILKFLRIRKDEPETAQARNRARPRRGLASFPGGRTREPPGFLTCPRLKRPPLSARRPRAGLVP